MKLYFVYILFIYQENILKCDFHFHPFICQKAKIKPCSLINLWSHIHILSGSRKNVNKCV